MKARDEPLEYSNWQVVARESVLSARRRMRAGPAKARLKRALNDVSTIQQKGRFHPGLQMMRGLAYAQSKQDRKDCETSSAAPIFCSGSRSRR